MILIKKRFWSSIFLNNQKIESDGIDLNERQSFIFIEIYIFCVYAFSLRSSFFRNRPDYKPIQQSILNKHSTTHTQKLDFKWIFVKYSLITLLTCRHNF